jgi:dTDP-4-dehydrorhamnose 3,5-epimerase
MGAISLTKILVTPLRQIESNGGDVLHAMKHGDSGYSGFGEVYFSWVRADFIKGWKRHAKMTMNFIVPVGKVRFIFCRTRDDGLNEFRVEEIGVDRYSRITVPAGIWFAFQGLHSPQSLLVNIASIPHDPNEVEQLPLSNIEYEWTCT